MNTPYKFKAVIFDLDGVITKTALVHSRAWKEMFDEYLQSRASRYEEPFREFTHEEDYLHYIDGKPRYEGVRSFLESRGINLPYGNPEDSLETETICGIGNRKNLAFNTIIERDGVEPYDTTLELIRRLREEGIKIGVASSSKNCRTVLKSVNLLDIIETRVDGEVSAELGLKGKPEPDIFTTAADNLGVPYDQCVVVEDALSGVEAGRKGNFGLVLGLAREDNAAALYSHGADIVVSDIGEIGFEGIAEWFETGLEEDNWKLIYHDYIPEKERSREALLSVGNGYFGTRGAMEESGPADHHYPGTYVSGIYNKLISKVSGRDIPNEDFVNVTNWIPVTFRIDDGEWFDIDNITILEIRRELNFRNGSMMRHLVVRDQKGRETKIVSRRFASMDTPHLAGIEYAVTPLNYSGKITLKSDLSGHHINAGVGRYKELNQQHLHPVDQYSSGDLQYVAVQTTQSGITIAQGAKIHVTLDGKDINTDYRNITSPALASIVCSGKTDAHSTLTLTKTVFISHQVQKDASRIKAETLDQIRTISRFEELFLRSQNRWKVLWDEVNIDLEGDRITQKMLRMHAYHLLCTTSPHNEHIDFGIPARGLTGEAYRGHIFWDELYILPFYHIHFREIARSVLMYRHRRLDAARDYAREHGYRGAMFPWQSGSKGTEETQKYHYNPVSGTWGDDHSSLQRHVSLAIAYNILQYHHINEDDAFMLHYGAEMILEICRFWASKASLDPASGRFSITHVMGPDEFHESYPGHEEGGLTDNTYTNIMAVWMFEKAIRYLERLNASDREQVCKKIGLTREELDTWKDISEKIRIVINEEGILAQYDGYFELKELDWDDYRKRYGNIYRLDRILKAEGKSPDEYKVAKQADTLMLWYNLDAGTINDILVRLGYQLPADYLSRNLEYYLKRTSHGSTLSRVVHAYLAIRTGRTELSWQLYSDAVTSDYNDIQGGTTAEGIHTGVMAGTILVALTAYAGLDLSGDSPQINPHMPPHWRCMKFSFWFRGIRYFCIIEDNKATITT